MHSDITPPRSVDGNRAQPMQDDGEGCHTESGHTGAAMSNKSTIQSPMNSMNPIEEEPIAGTANAPSSVATPSAATAMDSVNGEGTHPRSISATNSAVSVAGSESGMESNVDLAEDPAMTEGPYYNLHPASGEVSPDSNTGESVETPSKKGSMTRIRSNPSMSARSATSSATPSEQGSHHGADEDTQTARSASVMSGRSNKGNVANLSSLDPESFEAIVNRPSFSATDEYLPTHSDNYRGDASSRSRSDRLGGMERPVDHRPASMSSRSNGSVRNATESSRLPVVQEHIATTNIDIPPTDSSIIREPSDDTTEQSLVPTARQESVGTEKSATRIAAGSIRSTPRESSGSSSYSNHEIAFSRTHTPPELIFDATLATHTLSGYGQSLEGRSMTDDTVLQEPQNVHSQTTYETEMGWNTIQASILSNTSSPRNISLPEAMSAHEYSPHDQPVLSPRSTDLVDDLDADEPPLNQSTASGSPITSSNDTREVYIDLGDDYRERVDNPNLVSVEATPIHAVWSPPPQDLHELIQESSDSSNNISTHTSPDRRTVDHSPRGVAAAQNLDQQTPEVNGTATTQVEPAPEEVSLTKMLSAEVDHYKQMYEQLERKVTDIWNQREAFRVANDRIAANVARTSGIKSVRFEENTNIDPSGEMSVSSNTEGLIDQVITQASGGNGPSPRNYQINVDSIDTIKHSNSRNISSDGSYVDISSSARSVYPQPQEVPRGIRCNRQTMERLLNCGSKLYAFRLCTPGVRSSLPLYMDVCPPHSAYSGKVMLTTNVGLFKVSLVKSFSESSSSMLSYLRLDSDKSSVDYIYGLFNSLAEYVGLSWGSSEQPSQSSCHARVTDVENYNSESPPHVQIKYMHSLVSHDDSMVMVGDSFPPNCNIGAMFHGQHEQLFCIEETRGLRKSDLQDNAKFTFVLDTSPSTDSKKTGSRRFNSQVYLVNSLTREYLCVDILTNELRFAGGPCTRAYSKYVVPASFKMVRLYNVLAERESGLQGSVDEAVAYARYRRCVTERAASRHGYDIPRSSRHMVDEHGNYLPMTQAAGTPAPSPRRYGSDLPSVSSRKDCILHTSFPPQNVASQPADMYDIADSADFGSSEPSARGESGAVEMYNMLEPSTGRGRDGVSSIPSGRSPGVKDLRMKFEKLSSRSRMPM
ncbi:hypothetical protein BaOVIS_019000 [Babesia ovis]|uniref:Uncharacterized protein n=1 Tax=Babesia ovis TaxID=5869 RepID=A0A9W5TBA1_BABOV|nr:hypothetical protein BaOVIS_019000 [Babesia ovis]